MLKMKKHRYHTGPGGVDSEHNQWNYAIVHGILRKLQAEGRVERYPNHVVGEHWKRVEMEV